MKNFILILLIFCSSINLMAQSPDLINYQAVAHDASGALLTLQPVTVTFGVYQGSALGTLVWEEEHATLTTNDYGLFYTKIGSGIGTGAGSLGTNRCRKRAAGSWYGAIGKRSLCIRIEECVGDQ